MDTHISHRVVLAFINTRGKPSRVDKNFRRCKKNPGHRKNPGRCKNSGR